MSVSQHPLNKGYRRRNDLIYLNGDSIRGLQTDPVEIDPESESEPEPPASSSTTVLQPVPKPSNHFNDPKTSKLITAFEEMFKKEHMDDDELLCYIYKDSIGQYLFSSMLNRLRLCSDLNFLKQSISFLCFNNHPTGDLIYKPNILLNDVDLMKSCHDDFQLFLQERKLDSFKAARAIEEEMGAIDPSKDTVKYQSLKNELEMHNIFSTLIGERYVWPVFIKKKISSFEIG